MAVTHRVQAPAINPMRFSLERYHALIETGFFDDGIRAELLEGVLVEMSPRGPEHDDVIAWLTKAFVLALSDTSQVRVQSALTFEAQGSEPEPDLAVVAVDAPRPAHPGTALLVIEVADSSLHTDRDYKSRLYAMAEVPEYWIVSLPDRCLERYVLPRGDTYHEITEFSSGDEVTPRLGRPTIAVADLFAAATRGGSIARPDST